MLHSLEYHESQFPSGTFHCKIISIVHFPLSRVKANFDWVKPSSHPH